MSDISWKSTISGNWSTASNWSGGIVPGSADNVTLTSAQANTVIFTTEDQVASLISTNDRLDLQSGDLTVTHTVNLAGGLLETGGILTLGDALNSIGGGVVISTGDVALSTGATLDLAGAVTFGSGSSTYGARIHGAGTIASSGTVTIAEFGDTPETYLGGGMKWINTGTVIQAGIVDAAYSPGIAFIISNRAGAVFDFTTDIACLMNLGTSSSSFYNYALMEKTGGTGDTTVYSTIISTGTIAVETGTIVVEDGGMIGGKVEGPGVLQFNDGGTLSGVSISVHEVAQAGGDLILHSVTLAATTLLDGAQVNQTGGVTLGTGTDTGSLVVLDTYDIDNNSSIAAAAGSAITIEAGGVFAKTGGTGTAGSNIAPAIVDDGTIVVASGGLQLENSLTGDGGVIIDNAARLQLDRSVSSGITVTLGTSSQLQISQPATFEGTISNFVVGDTLNVALTVNAATVGTGGTLALRDGTVTVGTLKLAGNTTGDIFTFANDGHGGTRIELSADTSIAPASMSFLADTASIAGLTLTTAWAEDKLREPQAAVGVMPREAVAAHGAEINLSGSYFPDILLAPGVIHHF